MNDTHYSYASLAIKWSRLPLVYRAGEELSAHNVIYRWNARAITRRVDVMVCNARYLKDKCTARGVPAERLRVIYNVPPARAKQGDLKLPPVPPGAAVVTFIGRPEEDKGIYVLLDAAETILHAGGNLVFWIVGAMIFDEGQIAAMEKRVADAGLQDRIVFFGYQTNIGQFLARTDIHVCPSLIDEPSPNVILEAKQAGVPSVVFPSGGMPELLEHGVDGFVCRDKTAPALREGIEFFAADAAKRQAAKAAASFSLDTKFSRERYQREWAEVFLTTKTRRDD
jgi:glycosyltransferase involved in cell wall biosynthesis